MAGSYRDYVGQHHHRAVVAGHLLRNHRKNILYALKKHGPRVTRELKRVTGTGKRSGRLYSYKGRKYRASAPGEPPAKRSGKMSKSFEYVAQQYRLLIGNTAFSPKGFQYPGYLEVRGARPYFAKTIERLHTTLENDLQDLKFFG